MKERFVQQMLEHVSEYPNPTAAAEVIAKRTVIGLFKTECIHTTVSHTAPARPSPTSKWATAGCVDWYTNRRLHSSLGYLTPSKFEAAHYAALNRESNPV